jgi:FtsP/CotA-like multicopper oxidase with cupredoxin domain
MRKMKAETKKYLIPSLILVAVAIFILTSFFPALAEPRVVELTLEVYEKQIEVAPGKFVTMWTYNGTVPGPTIRANVGDLVRVRLINKHNLAHSAHFHSFNYKFEYDGADPVAHLLHQPSVVPPGETFTIEFRADTAGIFYYHCHSEDQHPIGVHMQQGLYGALIIDPIPSSTGNPPDKEYVVFFGEVYSKPVLPILHNCAYCYTGTGEKFFTVNARSFPLTETYKAKKGELVRFYVINIGHDIHTWHLHNLKQFQIKEINGKRVPELIEAQVLSLAQGVAAIIEGVADEPGLWLIHCHIVPHADMGMDALLEVTP